ncbi:P-loop containing nucleoside triphosphate hydrolase protein [Dentipellis sp. KUC8613]|nr:P-loop containing nucleoside triphosphate hydrolase protein [Dentipellis sp. KUC8613]
MATQTTPRTTRSSVLGKRSHQSRSDLSSSSSEAGASCDSIVDVYPPTPETPIAKRARTSSMVVDGDGNKENIPPFRGEVGDSPSSSRSSRLRRTSTEIITPTRPRTTPRRHASMSNIVPQTPASAMARLDIQTPPSTPSFRLPLHARARALLRATCNSTSNIAGRASERDIIRGFITAFFASKLKKADLANPVLYISGSPGCGKTALVNSVLTDLEVEMFEKGVNVAVINCMALSGLDAVWDRLYEELGGATKRARKTRSSDLVEGLLARRETKCILVLDEIDHVAKSSQSLLSLFALAQKHDSTLRIVGIANTHTLTSSSSQLSMHGVTGVKTVHFSPYEPAQLLEILQARLKPLSEQDPEATEEHIRKFLPIPTLTLLSKKIATQTGDVRSLFEVLRGAIDLAIAENFVAGKQGEKAPSVTPSHILAALKAYAPVSKIGALPVSAGASTKSASNSEIVTKVRNLGLQARIVLLAFLLACKRVEASLSLGSGSPSPSLTPPRSPVKRSNSSNNVFAREPSNAGPASVDTHHLHSFYTTILTRGGEGMFTPVSRSEFSDLAGILETVGLVSLSSPGGVQSSPTKRKFGRTGSFAGGMNKGGQGQEVKFVQGIRADEVLRGLGISADRQAVAEETVDVREEEINAIWEREMMKVRKEAAAQARRTQSSSSFEGAIES